MYKKAIAGDAFYDLVAEYSDEPNASRRNGQLPAFTRGTMAKPFEDAAFSMKEAGEISRPVKTQFGYHIILFKNYFPAKQLSFEEVKSRLVDELSQAHLNSLRQQKLAEPSNAPGMQVNTDAIDALVTKED